MKHIGYTNGEKWGSDFPSGPVKLFIPEPGMRENVSADNYEHIGWIIPDSDDRSNVWSGKGIYETHEHAGPDSRPAYVFRVAAAAPMVPTGSGHMLTEPITPTEPRCPHCGAQVDERWDCCKTHAATAQPDKVVAKITMGKEYGTIHHPLPPNDKHGIPTSELLSEALDFCASCIEGVDYPDPIHRRKQFDQCAVYIRELVRRLSECHAALQPFAQVGAGGRGNALKDDAPLAIISANMPDLPQWIAKANCVVTMGDVRRVMDILKGESSAPAPTVQAEPSAPAEPSMTFYDYAFIHAAVNHADYYSASTMTSNVIDDAHRVAGQLTRNRANQP